MPAGDITVTERLVRKDRAITLTGLVVLTVLAWGWVLLGAGTGMGTLSMTTFQFPPPVWPTEWP